MTSIATWLVAMVGPLAAQLLLSLGMSIVVLTGATAAFSTIKTQIITNISAMPAQVIGLGGLFGIWTALGMYFGAMTFCLTWRSSTGFWALAKK